MTDYMINKYNELLKEKRDIEEDLLYTEKALSECKDFMEKKDLTSDIVENRIKLSRTEAELKWINDYLGMNEIDIEADTNYSRNVK